jgi:hypothetical protein
MLDFLILLAGVPVLLFLLYVPGAVTLNSLGMRSPYRAAFASRDEWVFAAVLVSLLVTGGVGFVLAEVGLFWWWLILPLVCLLSLVVAMGLGRSEIRPLRLRMLLDLVKVPAPLPLRQADHRQARLRAMSLALIVVVAVALFSRPAEMLRGALDSGVYVNAGVALGRTGAILQRDVLMRQLNDDVGEGNELLQGQSLYRYTLDRLRLSGFYVLDKKAALVLPQHYSLYPVWIGLLYSLFGIWGALYATPLLMLLLVLAVYYFARYAMSPGAALLALALLVLCPVMIWFARYPVSEVLTGLLAFGGFYAFLRMVSLQREELSSEDGGIRGGDKAREDWASFFGVVAGVSLGQLSLARPDFIFYLIPVAGYALYWRLARKWRGPYTWFLGSLGLILAQYALHFAFFGFAYTLDLYHNVIQDVRRLWGPLLLALYVGVLLVFSLDRFYPRLRPTWSVAERWLVRYRWVWAGLLVLAVGGYAAYHYAAGPWLPNMREDNAGRPLAQTVFTTWESYIGAPVDLGERYNLLRIGWYLSPPGIVVGVAGLLRWIWGRLGAGTLLFFGCLLISSFVFIQETYTDAHYIYTMRRYVPVILPALVLGFAWACQFLWSRVRPRIVGAALAVLLAGGLALFFGYTARTIVAHVEEGGAVAQLTDLANRIPSNTVVIFSNERDEPNVVATPLQYVFGIESFVANRTYPNINNNALDGIVTRWRKQGYNVWVLMSANGGKLHLPSYSLKEEGSWDYAVPEFEQLYYQKPFNVSSAYLPWGLYSVQPQTPPPAWPYRVDIGEMDYPTLVAGWHRQERDDRSSPYWRWTGDQAILRLPWPSSPVTSTLEGGRVNISLRPETPLTGQPFLRTQPLTVTLSLDDTPIGEVLVPPGVEFQEYTVEVPPGLPKGRSPEGYAMLRIASPTWSGLQAGLSYDARTLGIQVDAVRVGP